MAETAAAGGERSTTAAHPWIGELLLRLLGAALQILATWAVVHALTPEEAGVYFRGFVIALGLEHALAGQVRDLHGAAHHRAARHNHRYSQWSTTDAARAADAAAVQPPVCSSLGRDGRPRHPGPAAANHIADLSALRARRPLRQPVEPVGRGAAGGQSDARHRRGRLCREPLHASCGGARTFRRVARALLLGVPPGEPRFCGSGGGARLACLPGRARRGLPADLP